MVCGRTTGFHRVGLPMTDVLVIPDVHCLPQYDNERLVWLGKYISDQRPDHVMCLGDFADVGSLCSYEKGTASFEGRRYEKDVLVTQEGLVALLSPMRELQERQRSLKAKIYKPKMTMLYGNHEYRIVLAGEKNAVLKDTLSLDDLGYEDAGFETVPFKRTHQEYGVLWSHYFASGAMGRAIGGLNAARALISKTHASCVAGHSHTLDFATDGLPDGRRIFGLVAGCYVHLDSDEEWNANTSHLYWNGVVHIKGLEDGDFQRMEFIRQEELRNAYR